MRQRSPLIEVGSDGFDTQASQFICLVRAARETQYLPTGAQQRCDPLADIAAANDQQTRAA
jgi:hypothetical protein